MSQIGIFSNPVPGSLETLTGDTGGAVSPTAGNINIFGGDTVVVNGSPGTSTLTIDAALGGYPITPYVVGPSGEAGYQTVQDGIDAANGAGGGIVYIQPGSYTEDLTLYDAVDLWGGSVSGVTITGSHTPPASGTVNFRRLFLTDAASILSSASAGTAGLHFFECDFAVTSGYILDLANWAGAFSFDQCSTTSTDDAVSNNTGNSSVDVRNSELGAGSSNSFSVSGSCSIYGSTINSPMDFVTGASAVTIESSLFNFGLTLNNDSTGTIYQSSVSSGATASITMSSSNAWQLYDVVIASTANPCIAGSGVGVLSLDSISFTSNSAIAGTLSYSSANFYSATLKTDYTVNGVIVGQGTSTDLVATAAGTDGQVLLGATGADPAFATLTSAGGTILFTPGANSLNLETATSVATSYDCDSGSAVPAAGVLTVAGAGGITTSGAGSTVTVTGSGASIFTWVEETGTTANLVAGQGVIANNVTGITLTLPATAAQGTVIRIAGVGAGGWIIDQGTGQSINYLGTSTTTTTGTLAGDEVNASIELLCIVADTTWLVLSSVGNFTIT